MIIKKYILYFIPIYFFSSLGFFYLGLPSLLGEIDIQLYSDSLLYEQYARNLPDGLELISLKGNFLGPLFLLDLLDFNYLYIYLFNSILMIISVSLLVKNYNVNSFLLVLFIFINPLVFCSLWSVNKEILLFFDFTLFLVYVKNKKKLFLFLAIIVSPMIRWQITIFLLIIMILLIIDTKIKYRKTIFFFSLISLSIIYPQISFVFEDVVNHALAGQDKDSGKGIYPMLNNLQNNLGGYIFAFVPKTLQLLYGQLFRITNITDFSAFWNNVVLMLNTVATSILSIYIIYKKRISIKNDILVYIALFYVLIFTLTPIYNTRYMFPIYIILVIVASQKTIKHRKKNGKFFN